MDNLKIIFYGIRKGLRRFFSYLQCLSGWPTQNSLGSNKGISCEENAREISLNGYSESLDVNVLQDFFRLATKTTHEVSSILENLNSICQKIGQQLPLINNEIKTSNQGSRSQFTLFVDNELENMLKGLEKVVSAIIKYIKRIDQHDSMILKAFCNSLETISEISRSINEVSQLSSEMQLLSLNAIILAAKAGQTGRAFGCGAEQLNRVGTEIMDVAENIKTLDMELQDAHSKLNGIIKSNEVFFQEKLSNMSKELDDFLKTFVKNIKNVVRVLSDIMNRSEKIGMPTQEIMNALQRQEIIGNKLLHINTSLLKGMEEVRKIRDSKAEGDEAAYIHRTHDQKEAGYCEIFSFIKQTSENSITLLDGLKISINELVGVLEQKFSEIRITGRGVLDDKDILAKFLFDRDQGIASCQNFSSYFLGNDPLRPLADIFQSGEKILEKELQVIEAIVESNNQIKDNNTNIINALNQLNEEFSKIKTLAKKLLFIDVNIKIEIGSSIDLLRNSGFAVEMEKLVEQAVNIRYNVSKKLLALRKTLIHLIEEYAEVLRIQQNESIDRISEINIIKKDYDCLRSDFKKLIEGLNLCSDKLLPLVNDSLSDITEFNKLLGRYDDLKEKLSQITYLIRDIAHNFGLNPDSAMVKDPTLTNIIGRFMEFQSDMRKPEAGAETKRSEGNNEAGDLTLF